MASSGASGAVMKKGKGKGNKAEGEYVINGNGDDGDDDEVVKKSRPRCPRCDSINTKFCYYNNYSTTQPRFLCKDCRRYWTKGGSLRNVPVGGGYRKPSNKRSSSSSSTASSAAAATVPGYLLSSSATMNTHEAGFPFPNVLPTFVPTSLDMSNPNPNPIPAGDHLSLPFRPAGGTPTSSFMDMLLRGGGLFDGSINHEANINGGYYMRAASGGNVINEMVMPPPPPSFGGCGLMQQQQGMLNNNNVAAVAMDHFGGALGRASLPPLPEAAGQWAPSLPVLGQDEDVVLMDDDDNNNNNSCNVGIAAGDDTAAAGGATQPWQGFIDSTSALP